MHGWITEQPYWAQGQGPRGQRVPETLYEVSVYVASLKIINSISFKRQKTAKTNDQKETQMDQKLPQRFAK